MPLILSPTQIAFNALGDGKFHRPFDEQLAFFKQKENVPTQRFDDVLAAGHDRAFMVAGATKAELLTDFNKAVTKAIEEGKGLQWFQKEFDSIVKKHGWEGWTGSESAAGRDWRTRIIYQTNLSTSYAAGRYAQLKDPDVIKLTPYWKYIHSDAVAHPRPLHLEWDGTVLPHDDPWFDEHYPPNGWNCHCRIEPCDASEYEGAANKGKAPDNGTYEYKDKAGNTHVIPKGIDYGFGYTPGKSTYTPVSNAKQSNVPFTGTGKTAAKTSLANEEKPSNPANQPAINSDIVTPGDVSMKNMLDSKLISMPAPIGADMMTELKPLIASQRQADYQVWLNDLDTKVEAKSKVMIVGAIDKKDLNWLAEKNITAVTSEIAIASDVIVGPKAVRHHKAGNALSKQDWQNLPDQLDKPQAVLFDNDSGKLVYILSGKDTKHPQIVVEFDFQKGKQKTITNMIVSGYLAKTQDLKARVNNASLTLMRGSLE